MLSEKIASNKQHLWQARGTMDLIVLIDEDSTESQALDKPVWVLRNILLKVSQLASHITYLPHENFILNLFFLHILSSVGSRYHL